MKQRPRKVLLNEELADWAAVYLAMWKALESFDPAADRWAEPVPFGDSTDRLKAAENAIARVRQRHTGDTERQLHIQEFRHYIQRLASGIPFGDEEAQFARRVRQIGSSLADQSVTAAHVADQR